MAFVQQCLQIFKYNFVWEGDTGNLLQILVSIFIAIIISIAICHLWSTINMFIEIVTVLCILSFTFIGDCTNNIFAQNIHVALRSSDCKVFCKCTYNTATTFKWVQAHCPPGTKFDNLINACTHASRTTCGKCILLCIKN